jgi:hypothetical protein
MKICHSPTGAPKRTDGGDELTLQHDRDVMNRSKGRRYAAGRETSRTNSNATAMCQWFLVN